MVKGPLIGIASRRLAPVLLVFGPLSGTSTFLATAVFGAQPASAASVACVDVLPASNANNWDTVVTPVVGVGTGECGGFAGNDASGIQSSGGGPFHLPPLHVTGAINVCGGGGPDPTATGPEFGSIVAVSQGNTQVWASTIDPDPPAGQAEVDGIGIATEQAGCS